MARNDTEQTTAVRHGYGFDEKALGDWLASNVPHFRGDMVIEKFSGGQSNPTFKITSGTRSLVLRRKPPGNLAKGAHAIEREARVLAALERANFPVPHVYGLCPDEEIVGTPFYVMDMVEGRIFWDAALPGVGLDERSAIFDAMNATAAHLHTVDYNAIGLGDFGRPGSYFERQIGRWSKQYFEGVEAGRNSDIERLIEWLPANIPSDAEAPTLTHGDLRIDNLIFHPTQPQVIAVLDWELSTIGHAGSDFAYNAMMYRVPPYIVGGLAGTDLQELRIPNEREYLAAYCARTGRAEFRDYDYCMAFNFFRLSVIFHGIKARVGRGNASSAEAADRVRILPELASLAWEQAKAAGA